MLSSRLINIFFYKQKTAYEMRISDWSSDVCSSDLLDIVRRLLDEEGLCLGLSSGINVAGAMALARQLGPGKRIATILCDSGFRYLSTLYNPERSEEHTSELQSLLRISYAVFCLKKKRKRANVKTTLKPATSCILTLTKTTPNVHILR